MKTKIIFIINILLFASISFIAQNSKSVITQTLNVRGNCGQCKERIESAVDVKGVKYAEWNKKTQVLTITYKPSVISIDEIKTKILNVGHDVDTLKANDSVYDKLPDCCKFRHVKPH